jgi:hypothetical protein
MPVAGIHGAAIRYAIVTASGPWVACTLSARNARATGQSYFRERCEKDRIAPAICQDLVLDRGQPSHSAASELV